MVMNFQFHLQFFWTIKNSLGRYFINKNGDSKVDHYILLLVTSFFKFGTRFISSTNQTKDEDISRYLAISSIFLIFIFSLLILGDFWALVMELIIYILYLSLLFIFLPFLLTGIIRKVRAYAQGRKGPKLIQFYWEVSKAFLKVPVLHNYFSEISNLAPRVALYSSFMLWTIVLFEWAPFILIPFFLVSISFFIYRICNGRGYFLWRNGFKSRDFIVSNGRANFYSHDSCSTIAHRNLRNSPRYTYRNIVFGFILYDDIGRTCEATFWWP